ncbi:MAG: hypothetical protein AVDCRST_MAG36-2982, partial [uncultured Nocardioidaceae bacterium]
ECARAGRARRGRGPGHGPRAAVGHRPGRRGHQARLGGTRDRAAAGRRDHAALAQHAQAARQDQVRGARHPVPPGRRPARSL